MSVQVIPSTPTRELGALDYVSELCRVVAEFREDEDIDRELNENYVSVHNIQLQPQLSKSNDTKIEYSSLKIPPTMIFVNTARMAVELAEELTLRGLKCAQYHKLLTMNDRMNTLRLLQSGEVSVLVATDHASR